jgi:NAD(P)-dependent dehydrogenase (short-subunit alcohol dehydrogenase family)
VPALEQQVILVTGATDGHGRALARELASRGATVLLHGRDAAKGEATVRELRTSTGNERLGFYRADLGSLDEVRDLAERVTAEQDRLDVLVNNAGIGTGRGGGGERELSRDGYELRFAVNYLAPFLLTHLLVPLLTSSAPARIVNVSSAGQAAIDFDDVQLEQDYDGIQAYCQSKLALVMLTFDLADELRGRGVTATCLHPGTFMPTKMVLESGVTPADSLASGVAATLRLVADPKLGAPPASTSSERARRLRTRRPTTPTPAARCASSAPSSPASHSDSRRLCPPRPRRPPRD